MEDLGVDRRVLLKWNSRKRYGGMEWIDLAQVRDRWQPVVIAVVNIRGIAGIADDTMFSPGVKHWVNRLVLDYIYIYIYIYIHEGWNFNSSNYLFTTDTK